MKARKKHTVHLVFERGSRSKTALGSAGSVAKQPYGEVA